MRGVWALGLFVGLVGCGDESVCETAASKLDSCKPRIRQLETANPYVPLPLTVDPDHCSGLNECVAKCVAPASCADIEYAMNGGSTDPNTTIPAGGPKLLGCVIACTR